MNSDSHSPLWPLAASCFHKVLKLQGIYPPITTPFDHNGDTYKSKLTVMLTPEENSFAGNVIFNWLQATGVDISTEDVAMLSEHPNIIAIKESSGSLERVMQMIREVKPGFQVLVGSAPTYGVPGLKHAMDQMGYYGGPPRLPLTVPTPEAKQEIEKAFEGLRG